MEEVEHTNQRSVEIECAKQKKSKKDKMHESINTIVNDYEKTIQNMKTKHAQEIEYIVHKTKKQCDQGYAKQMKLKDHDIQNLQKQLSKLSHKYTELKDKVDKQGLRKRCRVNGELMGKKEILKPVPEEND